MLMNRPSKQDRRRFLLNTGILAAGWELSRADAVLSRELAPTPFCHDGNELTVRQTEGPFFKPKSPERSDLREPGTKGSWFELSGFVLAISCRPLRDAVVSGMLMKRANTTTWVSDIVVMLSPGPTAHSSFAPSCRRYIPAARGIITSRFKRRAAVC